MISIETETLLTFAKAAKELPGRPHVSTLHRWRLRGVRGIKLETLLLGGVRYTSREALQRFAEQATAAADGKAIPARSAKQREKALAQAERELAEAGL